MIVIDCGMLNISSGGGVGRRSGRIERVGLRTGRVVEAAI